MFLGDVSEERRAAIREEVADVVRFYAERFGVAVPESTLYVSPDGDAAAAVYRELTGGEYPLFTGMAVRSPTCQRRESSLSSAVRW